MAPFVPDTVTLSKDPPEIGRSVTAATTGRTAVDRRRHQPENYRLPPAIAQHVREHSPLQALALAVSVRQVWF
jgi:hypothetical protein